MQQTVDLSPQPGPALVVIDVQRGFDDAAFWGERNNPGCEENIAALIAHWRERSWPVVFVRHDSENPDSPLFPGSEGNGFKQIVTGEPDLLVSKSVNSSFYGTPDLHAWLGDHAITSIAICGITTNHCCETTARMGGNLGYDVTFIIDATHTFDRAAPDGGLASAAELSRVTATNLQGEFATVRSTSAVLAD